MVKSSPVGNKFDLNIYFAAVGTPNQRGLNENANGLLRKDGLNHEIAMNKLSDTFVQAVASQRNHISKKRLNYQTLLKTFIKKITDK